MKLKLAIIFGIIIWIVTYVLSSIFNPIFTDNLPSVNIVVPIIMIIVTGFFGILYIRRKFRRKKI
jgi:Na+-driven multidrug efflux pump